ncbi:MAG: MerR family transcriptional regulator [Actinomycetota bacterium]|nr:MerR family transcriptional regulator [Actinomycetota bacterium]
MPEQQGLSIGEVARRAGVRPSAIRYYEGVGLLTEPERVGGKRRYDEGILRCLRNIEGARRAGFTIREMRAFFDSFPAGADAGKCWRALAGRKLEEIDESILKLQEARSMLEEALRRGCGSVEECASLLSEVSKA